MLSTQERQLIERLLSRDETAFTVFYQRFAPKLAAFINRKIGDDKDAEEILQDTLFAFLDKVRDLTGKSSLSTYLCAIANHKIIDYYRKRKLKQVVFSQFPEGVVELLATVVGADKQLDEQFLKEKIERVFARIHPHYRTLLLLKYRDGFDVVEIAGKLACSFKSVESSLFRARQAFRNLYLKEYE